MIGVSGTRVRLADADGGVVAVSVAELLGDARFRRVEHRGGEPTQPQVGLDGLPAAALVAATWWEAHLAEVVYGVPPDAPPGTRPKPQYDPAHTSLTDREKAKAAELAVAGQPVAASTVKHRRQRWEAHGLAGLVDQRVSRRSTPTGRVDDHVVAAMRQVIEESTDASSRTASFVIWRTGELLAADGAERVLPSTRTMYRLFDTLSRGRHTTGSASTRRSLAARPPGMFSTLPAAAPGEYMQIDSTPLDVLVLLDDGVPGRVELTGIIDVSTRTVSAAVLRPTTRSVDAAVLLARSLTPEPMRPGWAKALSMAASVLALRPAAQRRRAARVCRGEASHHPRHHRDRPRQCVHLRQLPGRLPTPGHQHPAGASGQWCRKAPHRTGLRVAGDAVLPVPLRLRRTQRGPTRPRNR